MSILTSLVKAYDRMEANGELPPFGYASQGIHFCISLDTKGEIMDVPFAFEYEKKGKPLPRMIDVPYFGGRSGSSAPPYFLWDNSAYVLGVTAKENFDAVKRFEAFRQLHLEVLDGAMSASLVALRRFLENWAPRLFTERGYPEEILDRNIVFRFVDEHAFVHEHEEAKALWQKTYVPDVIGEGVCLVSGVRQPIARLHPPIKTFDNPARIVSFDKDNDAFSSYDHVQAENAPTGIGAAFAYTAALNRFLERDSGHRIQIGDASTVFWADAKEMEAAEEAETAFLQMLGVTNEPDTIDERKREEEERLQKDIEVKLKRIVKGAELRDVLPRLSSGVTFYVLGLSPNAARLSVRFFWQGSFGELADHYRAYMRDMSFQPWPAERLQPTIRQCALRLAPARVDSSGKVKFDDDQIPKQFAGEFFRSIITGNRFPGAVLGQLIMRIRSDHLLDPIRIAIIKAILVRNLRIDGCLPRDSAGNIDEDYLMQPDPDDPNTARRLGRLFAIMERIQSASLGENVNASIKDKYLSAAAATPAQVFSGLLKLTEHHLSRLRRGHSDADWVQKAADKAGITKGLMAGRLYRRLSLDMGRTVASFHEAGFPVQHDRDEQGFFMIGYYQERYGRSAGTTSGETADVDDIAMIETNEE